MRCVICNEYTTGGDVSDVCTTCSDIINNSLIEDKEESVEYSVIPSEVDSYGRVKSYKYE